MMVHPSSGSRRRLPFLLAGIACLVGLVALLVPVRAGRADVVGPMEEACLSLREGDACDERNDWQHGLAYRGVCVLYHFGEGRDRLKCRPGGPPLTPVQEACVDTAEGEACTRPTGAIGRCVKGTTRTVPGFGGKGTVDLPLLECAYFKPDRSGEGTWAAIGLGACAIAIAGVVMFLRRRAARKADEEARS